MGLYYPLELSIALNIVKLVLQMANRVNLKVSELTHESIKAAQREGETIDDTLRRLTGVVSGGVNIDDLAAYLPENLRERANDLVKFIDGLADFDVDVERDANDGYDHIRFKSPDTGITIARVRFGEAWLMTDYRNRKGELEEISAFPEDGDDDVGLNLNIEDDWVEIKEANRRKIEGAYRKWGGAFLPQMAREFTTNLPELLEVATNRIIEKYIVPGNKFELEIEDEDSRSNLNFFSQDTSRVICQVSTFSPNPPDRTNYRIDVNHRDSNGELNLAAQLRNIEENSLDIVYFDSQTMDKNENTRRGDNAGQKTADLVGDHISTLAKRSDQRWG